MLKLDKYIEDKELHPENIASIFDVFDVLKDDKSIDFSELHPENM